MSRPCPRCGQLVAIDDASSGSIRCPVCEADLAEGSTSEAPPSPDAAPSPRPEPGARPERARGPSMVATEEEPRRVSDKGWERMIREMTPIPWDERDRTALARALDTILQLTAQPGQFFRSMATDADGGALRLAVAAILAASLGLAWTLTGVIVAAGTTVSPVWVGLEVALVSAVALAAMGGFRAAVTGLVLRTSSRRPRGVRRLAAFSAAPLLLGLVPVVGFLTGLVIGTRAYAAGLQSRFGLSSPLAWVLAVVPGPALFITALAVLVALVGA